MLSSPGDRIDSPQFSPIHWAPGARIPAQKTGKPGIPSFPALFSVLFLLPQGDLDPSVASVKEETDDFI